MRALRIILILVVILGGLFVIADRIAVHFAEGQAADKLKSTENLASTPDVNIKGFPFLTQVAGGSLDDVEVGIKDYDAATGTTGQKIRIGDLKADMKGVSFSGNYSSATADSATGTATISYAELMKTAKAQPTEVAPGITARIVGLSDGGNGKIKVMVEGTISALGIKQTVPVLSSVTVENDKVQVHADSLPRLGAAAIAETRIREITDFQQAVDQLPGGIKLDKVQAAADGVQISVKGSHVKLAG
ncbi:LmeA family phospholipid-binding protein [Streptomyces sp. NPDC001118]